MASQGIAYGVIDEVGMPFAVQLYFNPEAEDAVRQLWSDLEAADLPAVSAKEGHRPHLSLAVAEGLDLEQAELMVAALAAHTLPFTLNLSSFGLFPTGDGVLFLGVTPSPHLLQLHEDFFDVFQKAMHEPREYYRPTRWVPHCTLALGLKDVDVCKAMGICRRVALPLSCRVEAIGVVDGCPAESNLLFTYPLGKQPASLESAGLTAR